MRLYLFLFVLSAASVANARIRPSQSAPDICDTHELNSLFNAVCYRPYRLHTNLDVERIQEELSVEESQSTVEQCILPSREKYIHPQWSHKPRCIRQENSTESYCVYTSPSFGRGQGISIWTTSEQIEEILQLPAFTDPCAFGSDVNEETNPPYEVKQLPGRGIGLVANRTLQRGDHIFSYTPVLFIHPDVFKLFPEEDRIEMQRTAIDRLPPKARSAFMGLCGHFGGDHIEDVLNTNSFAVDMWEESSAIEYSAVFPQISRLNHDCRPNAHYAFDARTLTHAVHALRPIAPGEELTITYIDGAQPRAARQAALRSAWGFACGCSACGAAPPLVAAADERVARILELRAALQDFGPGAEADPRRADALVALYQLERLWGPVADAYVLAALEYNGVGEAWAAVMWAERAVEAGLLYSGPYDRDVSVMRDLLRDPRGHWSWMLRVNKSLAQGSGGENE